MTEQFNQAIIKRCAWQVIAYCGGDLAMALTGDPEGDIPQMASCEVTIQHFADLPKEPKSFGNPCGFDENEYAEIGKFMSNGYQWKIDHLRKEVFTERRCGKEDNGQTLEASEQQARRMAQRREDVMRRL